LIASLPLEKQLFNAVQSNNVEAAKKAIEAGAEVNARDKDSWTPLHEACYDGHTGLVRLLIEAGADVNGDNWGETPLHIVCSSGDLNMLRLLLKAPEKDLNAQDPDNGNTPLYVASRYGFVDLAEALLDHGACANIENNNGDTPLHGACKYGYTPTARALLDHGADINASNRDDQTSLHVACVQGHINVIDMLLKRGADVNIKDNCGDTALHLMSWGNNTAIAALLLDHGVDINATNGESNTPLRNACASGQKNMVRLLLERGANVTIMDGEGLTPPDVALRLPNTDNAREIVKLFKEFHKEQMLEAFIDLPGDDPRREEELDWYREHYPEMVMEAWCTQIPGT